MAKGLTYRWSKMVMVPMLGLLVVALASCAKARLADDGEEVPLGEDDAVAGEPLDDSSDRQPLDEEVGIDEELNPAAIDEVDPFVGATITVTGTVDEVVDRNAFEVDSNLYSQSDRQHVIVAESVEVVGQGVG